MIWVTIYSEFYSVDVGILEFFKYLYFEEDFCILMHKKGL